MNEVISSAANPRIRAAVKLRDRRERERSGLTIVDGAREVRRAIHAGVQMREAFVCDELVESPDAVRTVDALREAGATIVTVSRSAFEKVAFGERADGVVAIVEAPPSDLAALQLPPDPLVVVVEGVEKPGNLGAILRSADGAGADAVIAASPRTDLYNPNAIRASLGTVFTVRVGAGATDDVAAFLRESQVRIIAARVDGSTPYADVDMRGPLAIVVGSENAGLSRAWSAPDVTAVRLPMLGVADSLNVSAAAAVLLYEARRQRGVDERDSREPAH